MNKKNPQYDLIEESGLSCSAIASMMGEKHLRIRKMKCGLVKMPQNIQEFLVAIIRAHRKIVNKAK